MGRTGVNSGEYWIGLLRIQVQTVVGRYFRTDIPLNMLIASTLILLTVAVSLSLGVLASYLALRVVLFTFGRRAQQPAPVMMSRAHAAGD